MRAVIDTSAWVSAVLSRGGRAAGLIAAFEADRFTVVTSAPLHAETEEVLERPELVLTGAARITARSLLAALRQRADVVEITGAADVLVSQDKDLTDDPGVAAVLKGAHVRVLTLGQFLDEMERDA